MRAVAEAHGQGVLAHLGVARDVAEVVHHQQRGGQHAHRHRGPQAECREVAELHVGGAGRGDDAEEHEHEELAEAGVAVGPRASRVEPPGGDGQGTDHEQLPAHGHGQRQARHTGDAERGERRELHRPGLGQALPDEAHRTDALGVVVGAPDAVAVVVGEVGAHLQGERHDQGGRGAPPDQPACGHAHRAGGADGHGHDGRRKRARPGSGHPGPRRRHGPECARGQQLGANRAGVTSG